MAWFPALSVNGAEEPILQLAKAIEKDDRATVKKLLTDGLDPNTRIPKAWLNYSPLFLAVTKDKLEIARILLDSGADPKMEDANHDPVMVYASDAKRIPFARLLIKRGVGIDSKNSQGLTALMRGIHYEKGPDIQAKLTLGADPNQRNAEGQTPLMVAASVGNVEVARVLLLAGAKVDERDHQGRTALAKVVDPSMIQLLLQAGADINAADKTGRTPPMVLFDDRRIPEESAVGLLLDANLDLKATDKKGDTILAKVVRANVNAARVKDLIQRGADPTVVNNDGEDLLMLAAANANTSILSLLLDMKLPATRDDELGYTAAHRLARRSLEQYVQDTDEKIHNFNADSIAALKLLESGGGRLNAAAKDGRTPLHEAADSGELAVVEFLLPRYKTPDVMDSKGATPLHLASLRYDMKVFEGLLRAGADINLADSNGGTVLSKAIELDNGKAVAFFIEHGADPKKIGNVDGLFFRKARQFHDKSLLPSDYVTLLTLLAKHAGDVNQKDPNGMTALMWVAASNKTDALRPLLKRKPDLDAADKDGRTALMWAASALAKESMAVLREAGANESRRDLQGRDAAAWLKWAEGMFGEGTKKGDALHATIPDSQKTPLAERIFDAQRKLLAEYLKQKKWSAGDRLFGTSPLHLASGLGDTSAVNCLLNRGADVNLRSMDGTTPLIAAAANGEETAVALLLKHGAKIGWRDNQENSAVDWALRLSHMAVVRMLMANKDALEGNEEAILKAAIMRQDAVFLREALRAIPSIPKQSKPNQNRPPTTYGLIFYAAALPHPEMLKVLREYPKVSGFNDPEQLGLSLNKAAEEGRFSNVQYLIEEAKADMNMMTSADFGGVTRIVIDAGVKKAEEQYSALSRALEEGHQDIVRYLVGRGAKIAGRTRSGLSPLSFAVIHGQHDMVQLFLEKNAPTESVDFDGRTPLHHAAERNDITAIKLLLKHGAMRSAKATNDSTPLDLARKANAKEAVAVLSQE